MKKLIYIATLALAALLTAGCGEDYIPINYMILGDVRYVEKFPKTFSINNAEEVNTDIIGLLSFRIHDSLLILSARDNKGLWSFLSLPDCHFLGKFLTQGQGPYEFFHCPFVSQNTLFKEKGTLYAGIYDFATGSVYKMNIDESLKNKRLSIHKVKSLPPFIVNFVMLDSTRFFCKEVNRTQTQQIRYIWDNNQKKTPPHLEKLNEARIIEGDDHNILSTGIQYDAEKKIMVEMPVGLNYINMYSIDGTFGRTICVGKQLDNIEEIQMIDIWERMNTFNGLRLFSNFWGVIYINEDESTYQEGRKRLPEILLFDWSGKPLAQLKLNRFITSFDIDFTNGYLYTLDLYTDEFLRYDIREILEKL